ncbi:MAG: DUF4397 domain-containing protein [Pseudomonadota bacterium]
MNFKKFWPAVAILSTLTLTGCDLFDDDDDDAPPPPAALRVLHASPDAPAVNVLINGDVSIAGANYKDGTGFGAILPATYSVQVDGITPGGDVTVIGPVDIELESDTTYTIIATGEVADIQPLIVSNAVEAISAGNARIEVVHGAPNAPAVDVYATTPGADLASSTAVGSFSFRGTLGPIEVPSGDYQIRVTLAGDPATVVYDAGTVTLSEGVDLLLTAVENTGNGDSPISLVGLDGLGALELLDVNTPASLRVIHNSPDAPAVDIVVNDDFDAPLVEDLAYPDFTGFVDVPADDYNVKVTPANDAGTVVIDADLTLDAGTEYSVYAVNTLANITAQVAVDDRRSIATEAKVRIIHGSPTAGNVDIFVTAPGADLANETPAFTDVAFQADTGYVSLAAGDYAVTVTPTGTTTAAIGPANITIADGGVYTAVARDPLPGETAFGLILLDDFVAE